MYADLFIDDLIAVNDIKEFENSFKEIYPGELEFKELLNCILCIIRVWSLFYSVWFDISLHFLAVLLSKTRFSSFCILVFRVSISLTFSFSFFWSIVWIKVISKDLITLYNLGVQSIMWSLILSSLYSKDLLKYKNHGLKNMRPERFWVSKEKCHL